MIQGLKNIGEVIFESKSTVVIAMEAMQYYFIISWVKLVSSILLLSDSTYFSSMQQIYYNFLATIPIPVILGISFPAAQPTKRRPNGNILTLHSHLLIWGNIVSIAIGMTFTYLWYSSTD